MQVGAQASWVSHTCQAASSWGRWPSCLPAARPRSRHPPGKAMAMGHAWAQEGPLGSAGHPAICFQFPDTGRFTPSPAAAGSACLKDYTLSELRRVAESTGGRTTRSIVPHRPSHRPDRQEMSPRDGLKENIPQAEVSPPG